MRLRFSVYTASGEWLGRYVLTFTEARDLQASGLELIPVVF